MKSVHPFPARMAPDAVSQWIEDLSPGSTVLDPMCGSGVVLMQAAATGHRAIGFDLDPLAVLMSKVSVSQLPPTLNETANAAIEDARVMRLRDAKLVWQDNCPETKQFIKYWFARKQIGQLRRLTSSIKAIEEKTKIEITNILWLALSRTIITKSVGASLAWDVAHSRPHKKRTENDYDVFSGFKKSVSYIESVLKNVEVHGKATASIGDARQMISIKDGTVDAIFTSPPYLNAIDYLRGHKFSLIWMGHTIPELRNLRSSAVGAERAPDQEPSEIIWNSVIASHPELKEIEPRFGRIVKRYVGDANAVIREYARVIKKNGQLGLVIGNSAVRGVYVQNSRIFDTIARHHKFRLKSRVNREILLSRRYLPEKSKNNTLEKRMRTEIISIYSLT